MSGLEVIKDRQRHMWTIGDYAAIAEMIEAASEAAVERAGAGTGKRVLDVATGTGNAATDRGARRCERDRPRPDPEADRDRHRAGRGRPGSRSTSSRATPRTCRSTTTPSTAVTSIFGVMFAPNQQRAADELRRVCRPGGRIVACAWTPTGLIGRMFGLIGANMPPPPEGFQPPVLWGTEERVRELFAGGRASASRR